MLASWHELIDAGRMSDGEPNLAGTAKPLRAVVCAATAQAHGLTEGAPVTVATEHGTLTAPLLIDDVAEGTVWLPANHADGSVRALLGAVHGGRVRIGTVEPGSGTSVEGGSE